LHFIGRPSFFFLPLAPYFLLFLCWASWSSLFIQRCCGSALHQGQPFSPSPASQGLGSGNHDFSFLESQSLPLYFISTEGHKCDLTSLPLKKGKLFLILLPA
jgi:hypothetical protein